MSGTFTGSAQTGVPKCEHGVEKLQTSMGWADTCIVCALTGDIDDPPTPRQLRNAANKPWPKDPT